MKHILLFFSVVCMALFFSCSSSKNTAATTTETAVNNEGRTTQGDSPRQGPNPEQRAAMTDRLIEAVGMDEEQASQFKAVNEKYRNKLRALRQSSDNRGDMREQMMALREAQKEEMSAFLTEEQMEKLQKLQAERRGQRGRDGRNGRGFGGRGGQGGQGGGNQ